MAYDIEGEVKDSADNAIKGVSVSDGVQKYTTMTDGSYSLKTDATKLTFSKDGYNDTTFDLTKYKNPSSVNVDITLTSKSESNGLASSPKAKNTKKTLMYVGVSLVVLVGGYFLYKKFIK
jgi:hypothetical protein